MEESNKTLALMQRSGNPSSSNLSSVIATKMRQWVSKKRIAISLISFTLLIGFNLFIVRTQPLHPFDHLQYGSLLGTGLLLFGLFLRSWAAGALQKSSEVTCVGPYALVRNPLYVGSFLMMFGFCILMQDWLAIAFVAGPMAFLYWIQVRTEERNLEKWFSCEWSDYSRKTGRFIPRSINKHVFAPWSLAQWVQNREYQAVLGTVVGIVILSLMNTHRGS